MNAVKIPAVGKTHPQLSSEIFTHTTKAHDVYIYICIYCKYAATHRHRDAYAYIFRCEQVLREDVITCKSKLLTAFK